MIQHLESPDVVRLTIVVGVMISVVFYERAQLTTGGAIVPAYLALSVTRPLAVVVTVGVGYLTHLIVQKGISTRRILYGRAKFEAEVLVGLTLIMTCTVVAHLLGRLDPVLLALAGIGFLVPGIIAHDMGRQRPARTVVAIGATTAILIAFSFVVSSLLSILPGPKPTEVAQLSSTLGYPRELLIVAVAVSVLIGMFVHRRLGIRSGGFITGAYLAMVSPRWGDILFTAFVAVTTWFVVVKLMMPRLLLFGRRKVSAMILVGALIGWSTELVIGWVTHEAYTPWLGLTVATLIVPALIANDAQRQGWNRTVWGTLLVGIGVYAVTNLIAAPLEWWGVL
jgi:poly-gamma-glutamate biosynthesis protein PgsC/CapC